VIDPLLRDKVVLITGGNSPRGIGAATARAFAAQGAAVFVHGFRDSREPEHDERPGLNGDADPDRPGERTYARLQRQSADEIVAEIRADGGRAASWEADLADPAAAGLLFDRAEAALGPVEVLVNNAAHCQQDTLLPAAVLSPDARAVDGFSMRALTVAGFDRHIAVNARAPALLIAEFARRQITRVAGWGRIVNVSTAGARGFPTEVSYGVSKYALESLSRAAAHELGPYGITVNVVSLGPIQTGWISPELEAEIAAKTPLRRVGLPDDVADVIVFLASEQARWITGQVLHVGGGHAV
jgi:3-oxoacyl-[acyl-carrier protein] reductase